MRVVTAAQKANQSQKSKMTQNILKRLKESIDRTAVVGIGQNAQQMVVGGDAGITGTTSTNMTVMAPTSTHQQQQYLQTTQQKQQTVLPSQISDAYLTTQSKRKGAASQKDQQIIAAAAAQQQAAITMTQAPNVGGPHQSTKLSTILEQNSNQKLLKSFFTNIPPNHQQYQSQQQQQSNNKSQQQVSSQQQRKQRTSGSGHTTTSKAPSAQLSSNVVSIGGSGTMMQAATLMFPSDAINADGETRNSNLTAASRKAKSKDISTNTLQQHRNHTRKSVSPQAIVSSQKFKSNNNKMQNPPPQNPEQIPGAASGRPPKQQNPYAVNTASGLQPHQQHSHDNQRYNSSTTRGSKVVAAQVASTVKAQTFTSKDGGVQQPIKTVKKANIVTSNNENTIFAGVDQQIQQSSKVTTQAMNSNQGVVNAIKHQQQSKHTPTVKQQLLPGSGGQTSQSSGTASMLMGSNHHILGAASVDLTTMHQGGKLVTSFNQPVTNVKQKGSKHSKMIQPGKVEMRNSQDYSTAKAGASSVIPNPQQSNQQNAVTIISANNIPVDVSHLLIKQSMNTNTASSSSKATKGKESANASGGNYPVHQPSQMPAGARKAKTSYSRTPASYRSISGGKANQHQRHQKQLQQQQQQTIAASMAVGIQQQQATGIVDGGKGHSSLASSPETMNFKVMMIQQQQLQQQQSKNSASHAVASSMLGGSSLPQSGVQNSKVAGTSSVTQSKSSRPSASGIPNSTNAQQPHHSMINHSKNNIQQKTAALVNYPNNSNGKQPSSLGSLIQQQQPNNTNCQLNTHANNYIMQQQVTSGTANNKTLSSGQTTSNNRTKSTGAAGGGGHHKRSVSFKTSKNQNNAAIQLTSQLILGQQNVTKSGTTTVHSGAPVGVNHVQQPHQMSAANTAGYQKVKFNINYDQVMKRSAKNQLNQQNPPQQNQNLQHQHFGTKKVISPFRTKQPSVNNSRRFSKERDQNSGGIQSPRSSGTAAAMAVNTIAGNKNHPTTTNAFMTKANKKVNSTRADQQSSFLSKAASKNSKSLNSSSMLLQQQQQQQMGPKLQQNSKIIKQSQQNKSGTNNSSHHKAQQASGGSSNDMQRLLKNFIKQVAIKQQTKQQPYNLTDSQQQTSALMQQQLPTGNLPMPYQSATSHQQKSKKQRTQNTQKLKQVLSGSVTLNQQSEIVTEGPSTAMMLMNDTEKEQRTFQERRGEGIQMLVGQPSIQNASANFAPENYEQSQMIQIGGAGGGYSNSHENDIISGAFIATKSNEKMKVYPAEEMKEMVMNQMPQRTRISRIPTKSQLQNSSFENQVTIKPGDKVDNIFLH